MRFPPSPVPILLLGFFLVSFAGCNTGQILEPGYSLESFMEIEGDAECSGQYCTRGNGACVYGGLGGQCGINGNACTDCRYATGSNNNPCRDYWCYTSGGCGETYKANGTACPDGVCQDGCCNGVCDGASGSNASNSNQGSQSSGSSNTNSGGGSESSSGSTPGGGVSSGITVGINAAHLFDGGEFNNDIDGTPGWLHTLRYASWLGARYIRIYGGYSPNDPEGRAADRANAVCGAYAAAGVPFLVSFSDKDLEGPSAPKFLDVIYKWRYGSNEWQTTEHWRFASTMIQRVNAQCPQAVFGWEIGNELLCLECIRSEPNGHAAALPEEVRRERMKWYEAFLVRMPRAIADMAPRTQRVSLGLIRASWADHWVDGNGHAQPGPSAVDWNAVYGNWALSFITLHPYGSHGPNYRYDDPSWFEYDHQMAAYHGKWIMLEEFGAAPYEAPQDIRREAFMQWIHWAETHGRVKYLSPWQAHFVGQEWAGLNSIGGSCYPSGVGDGDRCQIEKKLRQLAGK